MKNKAANSGITAITGFEFQRNCALLILLNEFEYFKEKEYFICIEHFDDFLYCLTNTSDVTIDFVHAYQAKKMSGSIWVINERFCEIISKILKVGNDLKNDKHPKSNDYSHTLTFISNTEFSLTHSPTAKEKKNGKIEINEKINEENTTCRYADLPIEIQFKIETKSKQYCLEKGIEFNDSELKNLNVEWIDFPRTAKSQYENLIGRLHNRFPHVVDPKAALDTIISLFRDIELIYNQGHIISFLDKSKQLSSEKINHTLDVIDKNQLLFDFWRDHSVDLVKQFKIPINIQRDVKTYIAKTYELLKDLNNSAYLQIQYYISNNDLSALYSSYEQMFYQYMLDIKKEFHVRLSDIDLFFLVLCSYVSKYEF